MPFSDIGHLSGKQMNTLLLANRELERKKQLELSTLGWYIGMYVKYAVGSMFDANTKYPKVPIGMEDTQTDEEEWKILQAQIRSSFEG